MPCQPALVVHGGAGNVTRSAVPPDSAAYDSYTTSLHQILRSVHSSLVCGMGAVEAATTAVRMFEDDALFNCGKGAVFNRAGVNELEASVMVSRGAAKRGVGVQMLTTVKNPILLARELLLRGPDDGVPHNCLSGQEAERLAGLWGLEIVDRSYFYTERRWLEHLRGLQKEEEEEEENGNEKRRSGREGGVDTRASAVADEYLPQGTVGCVALDVHGVLAVATSTGGLTNKLPGRIGDTPTLGAGFWAEEWEVDSNIPRSMPASSFSLPFSDSLQAFAQCLPLARHLLPPRPTEAGRSRTRAVALSGTGNGDYFLRLAAAHAVAARCRFGGMALADAARAVQGVGGEMQRAAGARWGKGDGEGGFIGIDEAGRVVMEMNCGGMFRGTVDAHGRTLVAVYRDEPLRCQPYRDDDGSGDCVEKRK